MTTAALRFEFPYHLVEPGDRLALYGAGLVGRYYLGQLLLAGYCSVSLWIDDLENEDATPDEAEDYYKGLAYSARLINVPSDILSARYDKVFIALVDEATRERAKQRLLTLGVPAERIICEDSEPT
jgi:hypothetical protein